MVWCPKLLIGPEPQAFCTWFPPEIGVASHGKARMRQLLIAAMSRQIATTLILGPV
jgi:hypothetical protein